MTPESESGLLSRLLRPGIALMTRLSGPVKFWGLPLPLATALGVVLTLHLLNLARDYQSIIQRSNAGDLVVQIVKVVTAFVTGFIPGKEHLRPQFRAVVNA